MAGGSRRGSPRHRRAKAGGRQRPQAPSVLKPPVSPALSPPLQRGDVTPRAKVSFGRQRWDLQPQLMPGRGQGGGGAPVTSKKSCIWAQENPVFGERGDNAGAGHFKAPLVANGPEDGSWDTSPAQCRHVGSVVGCHQPSSHQRWDTAGNGEGPGGNTRTRTRCQDSIPAAAAGP